MKRIHAWALGFGLMFLGAAARPAFARDLKITCMEMIGGIPSEPVTYTFDETSGELRSSNYPEGPLSSFQETKLGHTSTQLGASTSYSSHQWVKPGELLKRTVKHLPDQGSKDKPWTFVQLYDFRGQRVTDGNGRNDSCNHRLYQENEKKSE